MIFSNFLLADYDSQSIKSFYYCVNKFHNQIIKIIRLVDQSKKTSSKYDMENDLKNATEYWTNILAFIIRFDDTKQGNQLYRSMESEIDQTLQNLDDNINMDDKSISILAFKWKLRCILLEEKYIKMASLRRSKKINKSFLGIKYQRKVDRQLLPDISKDHKIIVDSWKPFILESLSNNLMLTSE